MFDREKIQQGVRLILEGVGENPERERGHHQQYGNDD